MFKKARAKVNLFLHVTGKREDNYHLLESMIAFAEDAYDQIKVEAAATISLLINGPFAHILKNDENNIILKAAKAIAAYAPKEGCAITLNKNLPVASGIGGGSADAALTIKLVSQLWDIKLSNEEVQAICVNLGADVFPCYQDRACYFAGIGEQIETINLLPSIYGVLVNPLKGISTKEIFMARGLGNYKPNLSFKPSKFTTFAELIDFLKDTSNDLEATSIQLLPIIKEIITNIANQPGCALARMSGTGATCFGLFEKKEQAIHACELLKQKFKDYWIIATSLN